MFSFLHTNIGNCLDSEQRKYCRTSNTLLGDIRTNFSNQHRLGSWYTRREDLLNLTVVVPRSIELCSLKHREVKTFSLKPHQFSKVVFINEKQAYNKKQVMVGSFPCHFSKDYYQLSRNFLKQEYQANSWSNLTKLNEICF